MYAAVKRIFDFFASGIALVILFPLWLIAALGIELSDPGPVFYVADRVGKGGKHFCMYKFRSMRMDCSANEKSLRPDQDRIFAWGSAMRETKLDELPQLLNVFWGDMSVIGPRPASADQVEIVRAGKYAAVSDVKPGLSGPSALYDYIYGDTIQDEDEYNEKVLPARLDLDLYYLKAKSIAFDLKMILWTLLAIFVHGRRSRILEQLRTWAGTVV